MEWGCECVCVNVSVWNRGGGWVGRSDVDEGVLRHGDLHGLQHLLHSFHGTFVLLGAAAGQL